MLARTENERHGYGWVCTKCGRETYIGFARCRHSGCRQLRLEFLDFERVVVDETLYCSFSGAETDVQLPNGDAIWAQDFLGFVKSGWIDSDLRYTDAFYKSHPSIQRRDERRAG